MNDFEQQLSALWQTQRVKAVDIEQVKKRLRNLQIKHRCYLLLDVLMLVPFVWLIGWAPAHLSASATVFVLLLGVVTIGYTLYLGWLRRAVVLGRLTTADHVALLRQQLSNNVRIARISKHSAWLCQLAICGFFISEWLVEDFRPDNLVNFGAIMAGATVFNIGFYVWAARREQRFRAEAAALG